MESHSVGRSMFVRGRASLAAGFAAILLGAPLALAQTKTVDRDAILEQIHKVGEAKIIAKLDVPLIGNFTGASVANLRNADANLERAIRSSADRILRQLPAGWCETKRVFRTIPFAALQVTEEGLLALEAMPEILSVEEDRPLPLPEVTQVAEDLDRLQEAQLQNTIKVIGADKAWGMGYTGKGWYVAILDTGILRTHEFFKGKTIQEACFTTKYSAYGAVGICPNGKEEMKGSGAAKHQPTAAPGWDHGTHVSGIAAGKKGGGRLTGDADVGDATASLAGVAKDASILAINVFSKFTNAGYCGGYSTCVLSFVSDQVAALEYVYSLRNQYKIAAVNMSLGGSKYSDQKKCDKDAGSEKTAFDNLKKVGITTVVASGNSKYCDGISSPGCVSSVIGVGATDDKDVEAYFSNWHKSLLDIFAPGVEVYSSTGTSNTSYASWNGTSMATPHVTGAIALIKQAKPGATVTEIMTAIQNTGKTGVKMRCNSGTKNRVQVDAAINSLTAAGPPQ